MVAAGHWTIGSDGDRRARRVEALLPPRICPGSFTRLRQDADGASTVRGTALVDQWTLPPRLPLQLMFGQLARARARGDRQREFDVVFMTLQGCETVSSRTIGPSPAVVTSAARSGALYGHSPSDYRAGAS